MAVLFADLVRIVFFLLGASLALDDGLARTPPMGYNTWNHLRCENVTAENVRAAADALVATGLAKAGYVYLNVDDCWQTQMGRLSFGWGTYKGRALWSRELLPDWDAFPEGMRPVADYVHAKGLQFGLYTDRGWATCGARPGSAGFEALDAKTFAAWGVDYLKVDSCYAEDDYRQQALQEYSTWRDALNASGRPILFSICGWHEWYARDGKALGHMWRTTFDVNSWEDVWLTAAKNSLLSRYAGPGGWNDPDMLLGSSPGAAVKLEPQQVRAQFALWCIMAAPLIVGANILQLTPEDLATFTNEEMIAVDQDPLGIQGEIVWQDPPSEVPCGAVAPCRQLWAKRLSGGALAVLAIAWGPQAAVVTVDSGALGRFAFDGPFVARDLSAHHTISAVASLKVSLGGSGDCRMYKLSAPGT